MLESVLEIIFEIYLELMMLIVPVEKARSLPYRLLSVALALAGFVGSIVLFAWGFVTVDGGDPWGWALIGIAVALSAAQIVAGCVLYTRRNRK